MIIETRSIGRNGGERASYRVLYVLQGFTRSEIENDISRMEEQEIVIGVSATKPERFDGRWMSFCTVDVAPVAYGFHGTPGWNDNAREYL